MPYRVGNTVITDYVDGIIVYQPAPDITDKRLYDPTADLAAFRNLVGDGNSGETTIQSYPVASTHLYDYSEKWVTPPGGTADYISAYLGGDADKYADKVIMTGGSRTTWWGTDPANCKEVHLNCTFKVNGGLVTASIPAGAGWEGYSNTITYEGVAEDDWRKGVDYSFGLTFYGTSATSAENMAMGAFLFYGSDTDILIQSADKGYF